MTTPAVRLWYALLVSFLACIFVAVACVWYTNVTTESAQRRSDLRWCALLDNLHNTYQETPPQTEAGKRQAEEIARLRDQFGCTGKGR